MTKCTDPQWSDMPAFDKFEHIADFPLPEVYRAQVADVVYKGDAGVSITAGNLFGSQTVMVKTHRDAFKAIGELVRVMHYRERHPNDKHEPLKVSVFNGVIIPNKETCNADKENCSH